MTKKLLSVVMPGLPEAGAVVSGKLNTPAPRKAAAS